MKYVQNCSKRSENEIKTLYNARITFENLGWSLTVADGSLILFLFHRNMKQADIYPKGGRIKPFPMLKKRYTKVQD